MIQIQKSKYLNSLLKRNTLKKTKKKNKIDQDSILQISPPAKILMTARKSKVDLIESDLLTYKRNQVILLIDNN